MPKIGGLFYLFCSSFVIGLSGAVMPGPLLVLAIKESAQQGFRAGPLISSAHALLELGMVTLLAVGLSPILGRTIIAALIGLLGGMVLLWMSWDTARTSRKASLPSFSSEDLKRSAPGPFLGGLILTLTNPFWFLWWMTVGAALFSWSTSMGIAGIISFYIGHILSDYLWYSFVSFLIAGGRKLLSPKAYRVLLFACALTLALLGAYFIASRGKLLWEAIYKAHAP